jgi:hypothetical protein
MVVGIASPELVCTMQEAVADWEFRAMDVAQWIMIKKGQNRRVNCNM